MSKAGRKTKSNRELIQRRKMVSRLYRRGWSQYDIAARMGVSQQQISLDLKAIQKEWSKCALRDWSELKAEQVAKLDEIEREAWAAWERSKKPEETTKVSTSDEGDGSAKKKAEKITKGQVGNPKFLEIARQTIQDRRKLLGLDAPEQTINIDGGKIPVFEVDDWYGTQASEGTTFEDERPQPQPQLQPRLDSPPARDEPSDG